jgi:hypothetical protein
MRLKVYCKEQGCLPSTLKSTVDNVRELAETFKKSSHKMNSENYLK